MKIVDTERLYLREFAMDDLERMSGIYCDDEVMRYIGRGGAANKVQTGKMIEAFINSYNANGFGILAVIEKEMDIVIGHCGFNRLQTGEIEIAYLLSKEYWKKGFATEISKATLEYGFEKLKLNRIVALAYPKNTASVNVIKKIGMEQEGERKFFGKKFLYFVVVNG